MWDAPDEPEVLLLLVFPVSCSLWGSLRAWGVSVRIQRIYKCKPICWHNFYRFRNDHSPSLLMQMTHGPGGLERLPVASTCFHQERLPWETGLAPRFLPL